MRVVLVALLALVLAACASTGQNPVPSAEPTEPTVLEDDGGRYTVSASAEFYVGQDITGQAVLVPLSAGVSAPLKAPRLKLQIRNYSSKTWGERSRAVAKIGWYDSTRAITGIANVALIDAETSRELVGWAGQQVNQIVPEGRRSKTVSYYSSYVYKPSTRMCVRGQLELKAGTENEYITVNFGQQTCEQTAQTVAQDELVSKRRFDIGNGESAELRIYKNAEGLYRGLVQVWATSGNWARNADNKMVLRASKLDKVYTKNPFTLGFDAAGSSQSVTRYKSSVTPVCLDVTIKLRDGTEKPLSHCTDTVGAPPPVIAGNAEATVNGVQLQYELEKGQANEGYRLHLKFTVPAGHIVWQDKFDYGNTLSFYSGDGKGINHASTGLTTDAVGETSVTLITDYIKGDNARYCYEYEGVISEGELKTTDYVNNSGCISLTDDSQPTNPTNPTTPSYTVIHSDVAFTDDYQALYIYQIHQHKTTPNLFRASVEYRTGAGQLEAQSFSVTGSESGKGAVTESITFTEYSNGKKLTDWIVSNEAGEEICYKLTGKWFTQGSQSQNVDINQSACVQMDAVTNPPTAAKRLAKFFDLGIVELAVTGNQATGRLIVERIVESQDTTGVWANGKVDNVEKVSRVRVNTQFDEESKLETGKSNGGVFNVPALTLSEPSDGVCIEAELVTGDWSQYDNYFIPRLVYGNVCIK